MRLSRVGTMVNPVLVLLICLLVGPCLGSEAPEEKQDEEQNVELTLESLVQESKLTEEEVNDLKVIHDLNRDGFFSLEEKEEAALDIAERLPPERLKKLLNKVVEKKTDQEHLRVDAPETSSWKIGFREVGLVVFLLMLAAVGYGMTARRQQVLERAPSAAELRNARLSKFRDATLSQETAQPQHKERESKERKNINLLKKIEKRKNDQLHSSSQTTVGQVDSPGQDFAADVADKSNERESLVKSLNSTSKPDGGGRTSQPNTGSQSSILSTAELRSVRLSKMISPSTSTSSSQPPHDKNHISQDELEKEKLNIAKRRPSESPDISHSTSKKLAMHASGKDERIHGFSEETVTPELADLTDNPEKKSSSPANKESQSTSKPKRKSDEVEKLPNKKENLPDEKKPLPDEKLVPLILSDVLDIPVEIQCGKNTPKNLSKLYLKCLPSSEADLGAAVCGLVQKRVRREHRDKVGLCVQCYDRCTDVHRPEPTAGVLLEAVKNGVASTILKELEIDFSDEDDFWSDVEVRDGVSTVISQFLQGVSGCGGMAIPPPLLDLILTQAAETSEGRKAIIQVLRIGGQQIKHSKRLDEALLQHDVLLNGLEILLNQSLLVPILSTRLKEEVRAGKEYLGAYFEKESVFGPLLSVSTIPSDAKEGLNLKAVQAQMFTSLPRFPKPFFEDIQRLKGSIQGVLHKCQNAVFCGLKKMMRSHRSEALEWIATVINMNEMRLTVNPYQDNSASPACCSDGFMQNLCAVLLEFCLPFFKDISKLDKIDGGYSNSPACLLNYEYETCLAGGQIVLEKSLEEEDENKMISGGDTEQFNFMTEIFHLTQRAMNVGSLPALNHFLKMLGQLQRAQAAKQGTPLAEQLKLQETVYCWRWDTCIMDPDFIRKASELYITQAIWLDLQLQKCREKAGDKEEKAKLEEQAFSQLPEYIVKDMAIWFSFVARQAVILNPKVLQGVQLAPFVDCCVNLLQRPDLVPGPIPASKIVAALAAFMQTSNRGKRSVGWGNEVMSEMALMVCSCEAVQHHLGPALLHTYVSVDVVEGLDVDKEDFDKYAARADISYLMEFLWNQRDSRVSVLKMCGTEEFQAFLGATLDTLLYQLHDSLARLANVRKLQLAKDDEATWEKLSWEQKAEKEKFLKGEESVARGFMMMAKKTLGLITMLSQSEEVARCFTRKPMDQRAANAFIGFIEALCGSKSVEFKVKDMEKYSFNPRQLLSDVCQVLLRIAKEENHKMEGFVHCLVTDPDYSPVAWANTYTVLSEKGVGNDQMVEEFGELLTQIEKMREAQAQEVVEKVKDQKQAWDTILAPFDIHSIEEEYQKRMEHLKYDTADIQESHSFRTSAGQSHDPRSLKWKALMKEIKQLQKDLPVHLNAAIFARQDENQMDIVRAIITGPADTPYSHGCFVFDIYFPANYPHIPPLVKLVTTGNGTVRFNPNLYADGKVCLSLLGTWHGGDASEKWNPKTSSLYQVLLSIQGMILIGDPMFNEPGYDGIRGTEEGQSRSAQYNSKIRLYTVRHAMFGQLRKPPPGTETIVRRHFYLQRQVILKQCHDWLGISEESEKGRLQVAIEELRTELEKLTEDPNIFDDDEEDDDDEKED